MDDFGFNNTIGIFIVHRVIRFFALLCNKRDTDGDQRRRNAFLHQFAAPTGLRAQAAERTMLSRTPKAKTNSVVVEPIACTMLNGANSSA